MKPSNEFLKPFQGSDDAVENMSLNPGKEAVYRFLLSSLPFIHQYREDVPINAITMPGKSFEFETQLIMANILKRKVSLLTVEQDFCTSLTIKTHARRTSHEIVEMPKSSKDLWIVPVRAKIGDGSIRLIGEDHEHHYTRNGMVAHESITTENANKELSILWHNANFAWFDFMGTLSKGLNKMIVDMLAKAEKRRIILAMTIGPRGQEPSKSPSHTMQYIAGRQNWKFATMCNMAYAGVNGVQMKFVCWFLERKV